MGGAVSQHLATSPVGWVFRICLPKKKLPADGVKAHVVADIDAAHRFYAEAGGSIPRDEFAARLWGFDPKAGSPTKPLTAPPTDHAAVFCLPLLPATSVPGAPPVPVVAADGPYPPELVALAKKHRPVFHLPDGVSIGDASAAFEAVGIKDAETLYPDAPKISPEAVKLPAKGHPVVYGHVVVRRAGKVARAFAQFYVLLLVKGQPKREPRGGWQFVQVEFVKGPKDKDYKPVTVGCSTRTGGHVRFFEIDAWLPCHANGLHPRASVSGGFAVLEGVRPKVFVAPDGESLFLGPGGWAAPLGDESAEPLAVRLEREVVAAPDRFHELYPYLAPAWIDAKKGTKYDTPNDLPFLLATPPHQVFWLGWAGNYGYHLGARPGPKYLAPPRPIGSEVSLSGPGVRNELLWWGHPDRFQEEYLRPVRGPRPVRAVTVSLNGAGDFRAKTLPGDRPTPSNGDVEYVPVVPAASGKTLARELQHTGELFLARTTPPPADAGPGTKPPPLVALARQTRVMIEPTSGFICFQLKDAELQEIVKRLAESQGLEWVALTLRVSERWLKAASAAAPPQSWLDESAAGRRSVRTLFSAQTRVNEAFRRAAWYLDDEARNVILGFFSPTNLAITGAFTFGGVVAFLLQGHPVGWALDVLLIGAGFVFVGMQVADGLDRLASGLFLAQLATTDPELDLAAQHLAAAVILLGLGAVIAWAGGKQMSRTMKYSEAKPFGSGAKLLEYLLRKPFQKLLREAVTKSKKSADLHAIVAKRPNSVFDKTMTTEQINAVAHEIIDYAESKGMIREVVQEAGPGETHAVVIEAADALGRGVRFKRPKGGEPEFVGFYEDVTVQVNEKHIFHGEINKGGEPVGYHHRPGGKDPGSARVTQVTRPPNAQGVYEATVEVSGAAGKSKSSTFFPDHWTPEQVVSEIKGAFRDRLPTPGGKGNVWVGKSPSSVIIKGYFDATGNIHTAFPLY